VSGWYRMPVGEGEEALNDEQLLPVLRSNATSLLTLRAWRPFRENITLDATAAAIEQLLSAAPRLRVLECDVFLEENEDDQFRVPVLHLLREPHFAPVRLQSLAIIAANDPTEDVPALAAWAASQTSLKSLFLSGIRLDSQVALDAVVSMAASQLQELSCMVCFLSPASLPALSMMLMESRTLKRLAFYNLRAALLVGASVQAFCTALRASRLDSLCLFEMRLWESLADGLAVIAACTGHPTLRDIDFRSNDLNVPGRAAIEAALDALQASIPGLRLTR